MDVLEPCRLSFRASIFTSVCQQGEVLLQDMDTGRIRVYKYQNTTGTFTEIRQLDSPRDINDRRNPHHSDRRNPHRYDNSYHNVYSYDAQDGAVVLQDDEDTPTLVISAEGEQLQEWQEQGCLIGCGSNKQRLYVPWTGRAVCIVDQNNAESQLSPGRKWSSNNISICEDDFTGGKAICHAPHNSEQTLDIFNSERKSHNISCMYYEIISCKLNVKLEALGKYRPPWPRQIIASRLPTVKVLGLGGERLTPKVLDHYLHHDLVMLPLLYCFLFIYSF